MADLIDSLDDRTAVRVADILARQSGGGALIDLTPDMHQALITEFGVSLGSDRPLEGELARQTLRVFAQDPQKAAAIAALSEADGVPQQFFDPGTTVAVVTAALIALQTHVRFERNAQGKISVLVETKPTDKTLLKPLVQKLMSFLS